MKRFFVVLMLIVLVVAISGCTNQTASNKTYSANGVTFTYPGNWSEQNSTNLQSELGSTGNAIVVVGDNSSSYFAISKVNISSDQRLASLSEWAANHNNTIKTQGDTYISEKNITIDGVNGIMMISNDTVFYSHDVYFIKNNTGYIAIMISKTNNQQLFEQIINSLKINQ